MCCVEKILVPLVSDHTFFVSLFPLLGIAGTDADGNPYIYSSINWQDNASGTQRLAFVLLLIATPIVVLLFWWIYRCRSLVFGLEPGMQYVVSTAVGVEKKGTVEMEFVSATKEMEEGGTTTTTTTGAGKGYDTSQKKVTPTEQIA